MVLVLADVVEIAAVEAIVVLAESVDVDLVVIVGANAAEIAVIVARGDLSAVMAKRELLAKIADLVGRARIVDRILHREIAKLQGRRKVDSNNAETARVRLVRIIAIDIRVLRSAVMVSRRVGLVRRHRPSPKRVWGKR